jgi:hypothetical protein
MALAWPQSGQKEYKANLQRALASHVDSRHARAQQIRDFVPAPKKWRQSAIFGRLGHFHIPPCVSLATEGKACMFHFQNQTYMI